LAATVLGWNESVTAGAAGVSVSGVTQALAALPAEAGAAVVTPFGRKLNVAVSELPRESVTTSVKLPLPKEMTLTAALAAPETMCTAPLLLQA
jgi:hypothetical protein